MLLTTALAVFSYHQMRELSPQTGFVGPQGMLSMPPMTTVITSFRLIW
jgi:hypothetical protein